MYDKTLNGKDKLLYRTCRKVQGYVYLEGARTTSYKTPFLRETKQIDLDDQRFQG